jgi:hypothetical protein
MVAHNELVKMCKWLWPILKSHTKILPGETKKNHKKKLQSRYPASELGTDSVLSQT